MDLPRPDNSFTCPDCGEEGHTAEFVRTNRDLDVLESFYA